MSQVAPPAARDAEPPEGHDTTWRDGLVRAPESARRRLAAAASAALPGAARWTAVIGAGVVVYAVFLALQGASPFAVLRAMAVSAAGSQTAIAETLVRATPLLLAALAVAVPARAGLFNIGGEGQLLMGAVSAMGAARLLDGALPPPLSLIALALAGVAGGALWALVVGVLRVFSSTSEAISSLLLNYVAGLVLTWLVFGPWKDPGSLGQAYSRSLEGPERLPILWGHRFHLGVLIALAVAVGVWLLLRQTSWGFQLRIVGGNPEAARRAGLRVGELHLGALLLGGALAGLGGMVELAGVEARLRPDMLFGFGFVGFLASWLARHHALKAVAAAVVLGAIAVGGNGLKLASGLSGSAVNILMAVLLLAVLGWAPGRSR
ncbi:MAG TPA: ABC transporter permease [Egibacteraceae bacterium]|nr:ABC transporter permease [Egibacteraceae bacterium]